MQSADREHIEIFKRGPDAWNAWRRGTDTCPVLSGYDFGRAYLDNYDFSNAWLLRANFDNCHLNGTNLRGATLCGASFKGTSVDGADFTGAIFGDTTIANVILVDVIGLDTIKHQTYSPVDVATVQITGRSLRGTARQQEAARVETFLRKAGAGEQLLGVFRDCAELSHEHASCFISYSSRDGLFIRRLTDRLSEFGVRYWLDEQRLKPGEDLVSAFEDGIRKADRFVLCCSRDSMNSAWVKIELGLVFRKRRKQPRIPIVPLDIDGVLRTLEADDPLTAKLLSIRAANFVGWSSDDQVFEREFAQLLRGLRVRGAG